MIFKFVTKIVLIFMNKFYVGYTFIHWIIDIVYNRIQILDWLNIGAYNVEVAIVNHLSLWLEMFTLSQKEANKFACKQLNYLAYYSFISHTHFATICSF